MAESLNDTLKREIESDRTAIHEELLELCVKAIRTSAKSCKRDASVSVPAGLRPEMNNVVKVLSTGQYGFHVEIAGREREDIYIRID